VLPDGDVEVRDLCAIDLNDPTRIRVVAVEHVVVNADDCALAIPLDELVQHAPLDSYRPKEVSRGRASGRFVV
jgi:hypothetical protein